MLEMWCSFVSRGDWSVGCSYVDAVPDLRIASERLREGVVPIQWSATVRFNDSFCRCWRPILLVTDFNVFARRNLPVGSYRDRDDIGFDIVLGIVGDSSGHLNCVLAGLPHVVKCAH